MDRTSTGAPEDFMFVAVGTGIGGALVLDGSVRTGPSGAAGEVGHLRAEAAGQQRCECGGIGCAHLVSSGRAIERSLGLPQGGLQDEVRRGSSSAVAAIVRAGETLGPVLADAATLLDLPLVVLGGGIGCLSPFVDGARRGFARSAMSEVVDTCRIEAAMAGTSAGAIGATLLFDD
jgi:glucokinase